MDIELVDMADMYANTCTRQEEKFTSWIRWGCPWRWEDCEAAYDLIREQGSVIEALTRCTRRALRVEHMLLFPQLAKRYGWDVTEAWLWDAPSADRRALTARLLERTGM